MKIIYVSPIDKEFLIAEVWIENTLLFHLEKEEEEFNIQFYGNHNMISVKKLIEIIEKAKKGLLNKTTIFN